MAEYDPPKIHSSVKQQKNWKTIDMSNICRTMEINQKLGATWGVLNHWTTREILSLFSVYLFDCARS